MAPQKYFTNIKNLRRLLSKEMTNSTVIHCRGCYAAPLIRKALPTEYKDNYILSDFRGLVIPEIKVSHKGRLIDCMLVYGVKIPYVKHVLNQIYRDNNTFITAVSPYFKQVLMEEGAPENKTSVHPNIVSPDFVFNMDDRKLIREKYNIPDDKVVAVISSSGGTVWQNDIILIDRLLELGCVVFNLGKKKVEKEGVINEFLPRSEMPKYLSAADIAALWRENIPLNNVACPSKFGEFVTMGLPIIHNGSVMIAKDFIEKNNAGIIVKEPEDIQIDKTWFGLLERKKRAELGHELFSVENIAQSYISHYSNRC